MCPHPLVPSLLLALTQGYKYSRKWNAFSDFDIPSSAETSGYPSGSAGASAGAGASSSKTSGMFVHRLPSYTVFILKLLLLILRCERSMSLLTYVQTAVSVGLPPFLLHAVVCGPIAAFEGITVPHASGGVASTSATAHAVRVQAVEVLKALLAVDEEDYYTGELRHVLESHPAWRDISHQSHGLYNAPEIPLLPLREQLRILGLEEEDEDKVPISYNIQLQLLEPTLSPAPAPVSATPASAGLPKEEKNWPGKDNRRRPGAADVPSPPSVSAPAPVRTSVSSLKPVLQAKEEGEVGDEDRDADDDDDADGVWTLNLTPPRHHRHSLNDYNPPAVATSGSAGADVDQIASSNRDMPHKKIATSSKQSGKIIEICASNPFDDDDDEVKDVDDDVEDVQWDAEKRESAQHSTVAHELTRADSPSDKKMQRQSSSRQSQIPGGGSPGEIDEPEVHRAAASPEFSDAPADPTPVTETNFHPNPNPNSNPNPNPSSDRNSLLLLQYHHQQLAEHALVFEHAVKHQRQRTLQEAMRERHSSRGLSLSGVGSRVSMGIGRDTSTGTGNNSSDFSKIKTLGLSSGNHNYSSPERKQKSYGSRGPRASTGTIGDARHSDIFIPLSDPLSVVHVERVFSPPETNGNIAGSNRKSVSSPPSAISQRSYSSSTTSTSTSSSTSSSISSSSSSSNSRLGTTAHHTTFHSNKFTTVVHRGSYGWGLEIAKIAPAHAVDEAYHGGTEFIQYKKLTKAQGRNLALDATPSLRNKDIIVAIDNTTYSNFADTVQALRRSNAASVTLTVVRLE